MRNSCGQKDESYGEKTHLYYEGCVCKFREQPQFSITSVSSLQHKHSSLRNKNHKYKEDRMLETTRGKVAKRKERDVD